MAQPQRRQRQAQQAIRWGCNCHRSYPLFHHQQDQQQSDGAHCCCCCCQKKTCRKTTANTLALIPSLCSLVSEADPGTLCSNYQDHRVQRLRWVHSRVPRVGRRDEGWERTDRQSRDARCKGSMQRSLQYSRSDGYYASLVRVSRKKKENKVFHDLRKVAFSGTV